MPSLRRSSVALVYIVRPGNVALTALSAYIGGLCARAAWGWPLAVACASASLIAAGGYVVNDVGDVEIDRINRPARPLPRGDLSVGAALVWGASLMAVGMAFSWFLRWPAQVIALFAALGLVAYAAWLKRTLLIGHFLVATISGLVFLYGGLAGPDRAIALVPAILAWAFHLGREMLKAAADREGDLAMGADTVAVRWGIKGACRLAIFPLALVVVLSPWPAVWGWFGIPYLFMVVMGVDAVLVYVIWRAWRSSDARTAAHLASVLKWDMLAGLIAVGGDRWANLFPMGGN